MTCRATGRGSEIFYEVLMLYIWASQLRQPDFLSVRVHVGKNNIVMNFPIEWISQSFTNSAGGEEYLFPSDTFHPPVCWRVMPRGNTFYTGCELKGESQRSSEGITTWISSPLMDAFIHQSFVPRRISHSQRPLEKRMSRNPPPSPPLPLLNALRLYCLLHLNICMLKGNPQCSQWYVPASSFSAYIVSLL